MPRRISSSGGGIGCILILFIIFVVYKAIEWFVALVTSTVVWKFLVTVFNFLPNWLQGILTVIAVVAAIIFAFFVVGWIWNWLYNAQNQRRINSKSSPGVRRRFSKKEREYIIGTRYYEQGGMCAMCKRSIPKDLFEIDHIIPIAKGGGSEFSNLQLLCSTCNRRKGAR